MTETQNPAAPVASPEACEQSADELRALIQDSFQARERVSAILESWQKIEMPIPPKEIFKAKMNKLNDELDELRQKLRQLEDCVESVHQIARDDCLERLEALLKEMKSLYSEFDNSQEDANSAYTLNLAQILRDGRAKMAAIREAMLLQTGQQIASSLQPPVNSSGHSISIAGPSRSSQIQASSDGHGYSFKDEHIQDDNIHFDKLYKDNRIIFASRMYELTCSNFYILRCKDHRIFFQQSPMGELRDHGCRHVKRCFALHNNVLDCFGVRIRGCTEKQAKEYDEVAKLYLDGKSYHLIRRLMKLPRPQTPIDSGNDHRSHVIRPVVGGMYLINLPVSGASYAAIILPYGHFGSIGLPHDIVDSELLYDYRRDSHIYYRWAKGYEDDGPCEKFREYPIFVFNSEDFPSGCSFTWGRAEQIQELDLLSDLAIPYRETVLDFVRHRDASGYDAEAVAREHETPNAPARRDSSGQWPQVDLYFRDRGCEGPEC
ncbi:hypothetical protein E4U53_000931 [Claviceps sorghi]|nr:hypothetical protein E4U53_000931 [Claviceps sorghi]